MSLPLICDKKGIDMHGHFTRREWLFKTISGASVVGAAGAATFRDGVAPTAPVAVGKCGSYEASALLPALEKLFDQLGGLGRIVKGKTVAVKVNFTGAPIYRVSYLPLGDTHYSNPQLIAATAYLMAKAGARRVRIVESPWSSADALEETMLQANWAPRDILGAAPQVEFENTNYLGQGKKYSRFPVPYGGYLFPAYDLNHSYADCDVFVSLTKMKQHETTGITLSMKNCFGITPCSIYGVNAGVDEPNENPKGGRSCVHSGSRQPSKSAPSEKDPSSPRKAGYRIPRVVVDLVSARPIHLAIVDGIKTMVGGEGPWAPGRLVAVDPGLLVAGINPVNTDAVCMALMGFDPMADRGTHPFETSDNMLRLAEEVGLGTRDLKRIEVVGQSVKEARFDFRAFAKGPAGVTGLARHGDRNS
jgi:uncharacterized protein (DUF362 family)